MKRKTFIITSIILSIIGIYYLKTDCYIKFNDLTNIGTLIIEFGVISALIEQFSNGIILKEKRSTILDYFKTKKRIKEGILLEPLNIESYDSIKRLEKEVTEEFNWISFSIGLILASFGFRFFIQISSPLTVCNDDAIWLFTIADIILTGILISGGSKLIDEIRKKFST